jgi:His-Xaa-Ser system radical SAM maturase HxsC
MSLGRPLHTHGELKGVRHVRLLKLMTWEEASITTVPEAARCVSDGQGGWHTLESAPVVVSGLRDPRIVAPGDVVRVREGSSLISVIWRRGARANSLFATERCNSLCLMCSQPPREVADDWRVAEMLATLPLIDQDATHLGITGGEPTLLGPGLTDVLEASGRLLPQTQLHVLTNGRGFRDAGAAAEWIGAGGPRTTWAVPLYADGAELHDEVVGAPGAFDETLEGLVELATRGARVEIRVVLHRLTIPRLPQLAAFIYRRLPFVEHVALMGLEPMGFAKTNRDRLWIDPADYVDELRAAVFHLANRGLATSIYNIPLCVLPRALWPFARQSISEWKNAYDPACSGCVLREHCAGFFTSAGPAWKSRAIRQFSEEELSHEMA